MATLHDKLRGLEDAARALRYCGSKAENGAEEWTAVLRVVKATENALRAVRSVVRARILADKKRAQAACPHPRASWTPRHKFVSFDPVTHERFETVSSYTCGACGAILTGSAARVAEKE